MVGDGNVVMARRLYGSYSILVGRAADPHDLVAVFAVASCTDNVAVICWLSCCCVDTTTMNERSKCNAIRMAQLV